MSFRLFDVAANLTDPVFRGIYRGTARHPDDLGDVLRRAHAAGLHRILVVGTSLDDARDAIHLAHHHPASSSSPRLDASVGCHPTRASEPLAHPGGPDAYFEALAQLIRHDQLLPAPRRVVRAIGECGLDDDRTAFCSADQQRALFPRHLDLARAFHLPLLLHARGPAAHQDLARLLAVRASDWTAAGGVVHSFDGSLDHARAYLDLGLYIGLNGCSLRSPQALDVVAQLPLDRILLETDAPWCDVRPSHPGHALLAPPYTPPWSPPPVVKKERFAPNHAIKGRQEPCHLRHILRIVARTRNLDDHTLAQAVWLNASRLFS